MNRFEDEDEDEEEFEGGDLSDEDKRKIKWMEMEIADSVGFQISLKTCFGDFLTGKILGVKDYGLVLVDKKENKMYCALEFIATYCIFNKNKTKKKTFNRKQKLKKKILPSKAKK